MTVIPAPGRATMKAFVWLFSSLCLVALLSPPGATHDEAYHMRSIWCAQGERPTYCTELFIDEDTTAYYARTNIETQSCKKSIREPLLCPSDRSGESVFRTNDGLYPGLFYTSLSWFVVPNVDVSVVIMRIVSIALIVSILGLSWWLLPPRYRVVHVLVCVTGFTATGYFLFASINPSSWTTLGVGFGWLALHAALSEGALSRNRRLALASVSLAAWAMALGSRSDAAAFIVFSLMFVVLHVSWLRFPTRRRELSIGVGVLAAFGWSALELFSAVSPLSSLRSLYTFTEGQRDNIAFFTENLLQASPNTLRALGTVPSNSTVILPELVYVGGLLLLGFYVVRTHNRRNVLQTIGVVFSSLVISLVVMTQIALVDVRDSGAIEPRYTYPLLLFAFGWWYLLGPSDLADKVGETLRSAALISTLIFALTMFTVAERFVDVQTSGLRYLPEGPDQWWWSWMPVGPNVVVLLATVSLWRFFSEIQQVLAVDKKAISP